MVPLAVGHLNELSVYTGNIPIKPKAKTTAIPSVLRINSVLALLTL